MPKSGKTRLPIGNAVTGPSRHFALPVSIPIPAILMASTKHFRAITLKVITSSKTVRPTNTAPQHHALRILLTARPCLRSVAIYPAPHTQLALLLSVVVHRAQCTLHRVPFTTWQTQSLERVLLTRKPAPCPQQALSTRQLVLGHSHNLKSATEADTMTTISLMEWQMSRSERLIERGRETSASMARPALSTRHKVHHQGTTVQHHLTIALCGHLRFMKLSHHVQNRYLSALRRTMDSQRIRLQHSTTVLSRGPM